LQYDGNPVYKVRSWNSVSFISIILPNENHCHSYTVYRPTQNVEFDAIGTSNVGENKGVDRMF